MKYVVICSMIILSSCSGWYGNQEEAFMQECEKNMSQRLARQNVGNKAKDVCECGLGKVKEKWSYDEFTQEVQSEEAQKIFRDCIRDVAGIKE